MKFSACVVGNRQQTLQLRLASAESSAVVEGGTGTPSRADSEAVRADRERG